ncbi:hypothetical protein I302_104887 [Kwoniella bestiolae CBS 10118]|uniref:Uncharacterized protein n=1 Tax=Kwoniella bestiolae CBS 10118 TaxID=1296100 RepID=A0AAJ8M9N8_9TREE
MSPSLSIAEMMTIYTPPLSPSSSSTSSSDTPSSPSRLIFFPQPLHFDEEEEEDVFAATPSPVYRSPIQRSITDHFGSLAVGLGLGMGAGGIDRLPDEPFYPQSTIKGFDTSLPLGSSTLPSSQGGAGGGANQLLPSATPYGSATSPHEPPNQKERRKPFGQSFLPPLPPSQEGVPTPLVPMGFLSSAPPSSWRASPRKNGSSPRSPLRRTDPDILLPSSYEEELVEEQEKLKRPIKTNGHMRKSSNDSEMTIKLGNGFVALGRTDNPQDAEYGSNGYSDGKGNSTGNFRSFQPLSYSSSYAPGYGNPRRPNISRHVSQQNPTIPQENYTTSAFNSTGGRYRSSSTSNVMPRPLQQEINRPSSPTPTPYKPHVTSSLHQNGIPRPTSPISFAMNENYFHHGDGLQFYPTSRFTRPISPSLPEDLLTPNANTNTYTHQTLSSAPKRPKSPTTARESLNAMLVRHPRDEDEEGYEEDSLDRLIRNAQRFEAGSSSYFPKTPPKTPSSHPYTLPLPSNPGAIKAKNSHNKRGFPVLKTLFPPSPPPSSPSNPGSSSPDTGTENGHQYNHNHNSRSFDVNRVSEKLKTQQGRICFEEVEGVGQPVLAGNESDDEEDMSPGQSKGRRKEKGSRPGTGRRWTLPF